MGRPYYQEPEYTKGTDYPSDTELDRQAKLATMGLLHIDALETILDDLGIYFNLAEISRKLEELQ